MIWARMDKKRNDIDREKEKYRQTKIDKGAERKREQQTGDKKRQRKRARQKRTELKGDRQRD